MGCNVSKDTHGEHGDAGGNSKSKKGRKKSSSASTDGNCITDRTGETTKTTTRAGADSMENAQINEGLDLDQSDQELNKAATKIQASFRGHKVRKEMKKAEEDGNKNTGEHNLTQSKDDELLIDPDDPEVQKAAAKIQASFRGYMVRKQVKDMHSPTSEAPGS